ncbi:glycosyltransferase family 1 protein [Dysgonomonas sp. Marseille-P4361]|uniref:glycosyltransferase family 4 protein n=1 Tax=Dysgonomonas sp. Marseille-P4361 TaxID=2161820 RepID=UPI000D55D7C9|nr:glycosyltransferase family 1 protein [Dysgonomonas sp. Marseille-P4361]
MNIILDCERMKHPYTGLYEYCYQLGFALQKKINKENLIYYLPSSCSGVFGDDRKEITQKELHKFFPARLNADLMHTTDQLSQYISGNKKIKRLLTIHDLNFLYEKQGRNSRIKDYLKLVQKNIDRVDRIVTISNYVKKDILENLSVGDKPIDVIYNGCQILDFENFDNPSYKPTKKFLFSIGTVIPKKNFHVLPGLLVGKDFELIIAGKTNKDYKEKILDIAKSFNVEDRVKIVGTIPYRDKCWYFKNCTAFMFPSLAEGFGIPVIEAMYFGKPVFLSSLTSLPEVGGKYAYFFDNFDIDHMRQIFKGGMSDYTANDRYAAIKEHASFFSWDRCADDYYNVYKKVLGK